MLRRLLKKYSVGSKHEYANSYVIVDCKDSSETLNLESEIVEEAGIIDGKEYVSYSKGPLLLAHEEDTDCPLYKVNNYKLVDYSAAGRKNDYTVWIRKED